MPEDQIERVLVVPTEVFHRLGHFQGFCGEVDRYLDELLRPEQTSYRRRDLAEKDPSFKQLIPYVIFRHVGADGRPTVFQYTRGAGMGEGRLHRKRSVGIGGHISAIDAGDHAVGNPYQEGMRRELEEEVAREKTIDPDTLRRMVAKVEEYSESHRAHGLPDDLLNILKDDLEKQAAVARN